MPIRRRALVTAGVACLAALVIAGCGQNGLSSSSSGVTVSGNTLTIYISEPPDIGSDPVAQDIVDAERMAFSAQHNEVRDYRLVLETLRSRTLSDNARGAIVDRTAIAYLGEIAPGSSDQTVGITNALDLLQVSPTDTALELGQATPAVSGAPKTYFESWGTYGRTFGRVVPSAAGEARAQAAEMRSLGVRRLYVDSDASDYGRAIAAAVSSDAHRLGITAAGSPTGADAVFYGAESPAGAAAFFNRIATAAPSARLFGSSSLESSAFTSALAPSVRNLYVSIPGYLPRSLPPQGRAFEAAFRRAQGHAPSVEAIFGYVAMSAVLSAIEREGQSADNRRSVVGGFLGRRNVSSVLGSYSIDGGGNTSLDGFVFARMSGGELVPFAAAPQG